MRTLLICVGSIVTLPLLFLLLIALPATCNWVGSAAKVASEELNPRTLLTRYTWFKDVYSRVNAFDANLDAFKGNLTETTKTYGEPSNWPKDVRNDIAAQRREILGILSMRNNLASEYNAAMAKINYRFTNVGDLPNGATTVLPREFMEYRLQ